MKKKKQYLIPNKALISAIADECINQAAMKKGFYWRNGEFIPIKSNRKQTA